MCGNQGRSCNGGKRLIFSCSGAADVGEVADRAARRLTEEGAGKMFCLAGIGGRVPKILETTEGADALLAIDGCALDCARMGLQESGFTEFTHVRVTDLGLEKGQTAVTDEAVTTVADRCVATFRV